MRGSIVKCKCNIIAKSCVSKKDNANKGRTFYACSENKCKFFKWGPMVPTEEDEAFIVEDDEYDEDDDQDYTE